MAEPLLPALADLRASGVGPPAFPFYLMETVPGGQSVLRALHLSGSVQKRVSDGAAPQWLRPFPLHGHTEVVGVSFAVLPVGWVGEWHESPHPQWVIPVSGRWFLETMDGTRAEMGPGDLHFGQDQGTAGGKGHRSGQLGSEPCVQLLVQFSSPVHFGESGDPSR